MYCLCHTRSPGTCRGIGRLGGINFAQCAFYRHWVYLHMGPLIDTRLQGVNHQFDCIILGHFCKDVATLGDWGSIQDPACLINFVDFHFVWLSNQFEGVSKIQDFFQRGFGQEGSAGNGVTEIRHMVVNAVLDCEEDVVFEVRGISILSQYHREKDRLVVFVMHWGGNGGTTSSATPTATALIGVSSASASSVTTTRIAASWSRELRCIDNCNFYANALEAGFEPGYKLWAVKVEIGPVVEKNYYHMMVRISADLVSHLSREAFGIHDGVMDAVGEQASVGGDFRIDQVQYPIRGA
ncbi:hypothetical protein BT96DRAFT_942469 [Gymnopus androsaceus JB14]|uniref:Uncharacterized protein n=1 Tax=Gymnopus androsaceus JB14 TaxID=1447944 RepID=A0A6A4HCI7_9AGAR|nr:hypothetical protein BT96DRAFT_942469 [Gymnopus androsaceus JB14]